MRRGDRGNGPGGRAQKEKPQKRWATTFWLFTTLNIIAVLLLAEQLRLNLNRIWDHCNHLVTRRENAS